MAGLNFDITANNSDFLKKTEEIKKEEKWTEKRFIRKDLQEFTAIWMHTSWMVPCLPPMKTDVIIAALPEAMDV